MLGPGGLGEPTKASCTSVSTTSPQAAAAATAALPCQEKVEAPSIVKVLFTLATTMEFPPSRADELKTNLKSQVMEEDKKKQVLGNGLATESESPVVAKVQIRSCKPLRFWISFGTGDPEDVGQR